IDKNKKLTIDFELKPIIKSVGIIYPGSALDVDPYDVIKFKEGDFFEPSLLPQTKLAFTQKLESLGYPDHQVEIKVTDKKEVVEISIVITLDNPRVYNGLSTTSRSEFVNDFIKRKFVSRYNQPF